MIDVEELPSYHKALKISEQITLDCCRYIYNLHKCISLAAWETSIVAACAGYIAGVRHERKRQRQKAQRNTIFCPANITRQECELLAAFRAADDAERTYIFKFAKWAQKGKTARRGNI